MKVYQILIGVLILGIVLFPLVVQLSDDGDLGEIRCADWNEALSKGNESYQDKIDENCLGMTKEKAIAKLKELKELLELEVITQEDYDKEKAILSPIILGKE